MRKQQVRPLFYPDGYDEMLPLNDMGLHLIYTDMQIKTMSRDMHLKRDGIAVMNMEELKKYLEIRRMGWPYEDVYHVDAIGGHRFIARIGDELAGLSYAEISNDGKEAFMKMNLKSQFAEYGIGTELLELLMEDLIRSGMEVIRYEISPERYAFQIYRNLGFSVESQDEEAVRFIWKEE